MSEKNFKANCGCEIHIIKWNYKAEVASVKNCPLHKAANELLEACKETLEYFNHAGHGPEPVHFRQSLNVVIAKAEGRQ